MKLLSFDSAKIDRSKIKDLGNRIIITGTLAIADKWMRYLNEDGSDRYEYVPKETLFNKESLSTLQGSPLCVQHPGEVTTDNYRDLVASGQEVGSISTQLNIDKDRNQLDIVAIIRDKPTIDMVLSGGITELSPQYWKHTEPHPEYKDNCFVQTSRDYTGCEVSLVSKARGGKNASLHLGISQDSLPKKYFLKQPESRSTNMKTITIDGIDVQIEDSSKQVLEKFLKSTDAKEKQLNSDLEKAQKDVDASEATIAKLEADNAALEVKNAQLEQDAAAIKEKAEKEQYARDRKDVISIATKIFAKNIDGFTEDKFNDLNNRQIKEGAIALAFKNLEAVKTKTLGECSEDKIDAYWESVTSLDISPEPTRENNSDSSDPLRELLSKAEKLDISEDAEGVKLEAEYRASLENAWEVK